MSLVRAGTKLPVNSVLYSTTYPCHSCARHIVAAGVGRVVYLEPYSKSMAIDLHNDSIADNLSKEQSVGKVSFAPYQGVSPRMYKRIFQKSGELKDRFTGRLLDDDGVDRYRGGLLNKSYKELEEDVVHFVDAFESAPGGRDGNLSA